MIAEYIEKFESITWFEVKDGQEVFLMGTHEGVARPYGPYTVESQSRRTLKNKKGNIFMHYAEELLIKVKK